MTTLLSKKWTLKMKKIKSLLKNIGFTQIKTKLWKENQFLMQNYSTDYEIIVNKLNINYCLISDSMTIISSKL